MDAFEEFAGKVVFTPQQLIPIFKSAAKIGETNFVLKLLNTIIEQAPEPLLLAQIHDLIIESYLVLGKPYEGYEFFEYLRGNGLNFGSEKQPLQNYIIFWCEMRTGFIFLILPVS